MAGNCLDCGCIQFMPWQILISYTRHKLMIANVPWNVYTAFLLYFYVYILDIRMMYLMILLMTVSMSQRLRLPKSYANHSKFVKMHAYCMSDFYVFFGRYSRNIRHQSLRHTVVHVFILKYYALQNRLIMLLLAYRWLSARLQNLQRVSNGYTVILH